jgi:hypothetical protein
MRATNAIVFTKRDQLNLCKTNCLWQVEPALLLQMRETSTTPHIKISIVISFVAFATET